MARANKTARAAAKPTLAKGNYRLPFANTGQFVLNHEWSAGHVIKYTVPFSLTILLTFQQQSAFPQRFEVVIKRMSGSAQERGELGHRTRTDKDNGVHDFFSSRRGYC